MEQLITLTKIVPPRPRPEVVPRQRLLEIFQELLDYKLVLVIAPAGYGKTASLIDLIQHIDMPACWYALSEVDQDPYRFLAHFIASIQHRFPSFGARSNAALQMVSTGRSNLEQLLTTMVNELYEQVDEHFVFVIDDYHLLNDHPDISAFISDFVQYSPETCHLILASRKLLTIPNLALLVARGYVGGLDFEDLAFQPDELQFLAMRNYGLTLTPEEAQEVCQLSEGWITGLLLSAQIKGWRMANRLRMIRAAGVDLYTYLIHEVLGQESPDLRDFLLRTSVMDEFDAELCEAIFEPEWCPPGKCWQDMVDMVVQHNLFVVRVGETGDALRYHPLFREFLQQMLIQERPEEERLIARRLADIYVARGRWEEAYHLYQRLDLPEPIAALIEQVGLRLLQSGRLKTVLRWLAELPLGMLEARPRLLALQGYALTLGGEVERGLACLNQAIEALTGSEPLVLAQALAHRSVAHRFLGNYSNSIQDAQRALDLLAAGTESAQSIHALAVRSLGLGYYAVGDLQASIRCLHSSLDLYKALNDQQNMAMVSMDLANSYFLSGQHHRALPLFEEALQAWSSLNNLVGQANVLNNLGVHYYEHGDYLKALDMLQQSLACAEQSGYTRMEAFALASMGDVFSDMQVPAAAERLYQRAYELAQQLDERFLVLYLELARAALACTGRDWGRAYTYLDAAGKLVLDKSSQYEWGLYRLAMGRFYLAQDNPEPAREPLEDAIHCFEAGGQLADAAKARLFLAAALAGLGDKDGAQESLQQALDQIALLQTQAPVLPVASLLKPALLKMSRQRETAGSLSRLLARVEEFEQSLPALRRRLRSSPLQEMMTSELEPPTLVIRALGRAEVWVNGRLVSNSDWKTLVSRDLFFCLLAHEEGLTKEEISEILWPEASLSQVRTRFKNTIYRLRSAIGQDVILFQDDIYYFDRTVDYEYDVEIFLQCIQDARQTADAEARIQAYERAVEHYRGDYLPEVDGSWVWAEREHLRRIYVEVSLELAQLLFQQGQINAALERCQQILADDPCLEDAHRLAMRIYAATGNRAAVARQFELCQKALHEEIAAPPSPQTEELYASLMR
ncbi:tetratricopeptide repeat protein [Litorilinea aerophila]|uniref:Tetratricopeptide repeat protein n=1 Tax=Litorilinea aerophila TaxID=1204385 RepID=A0A540VAK3_9CHLR|nr:tetratricopeptide repeat protein [Litorilinea aerophila]MCC9078399.1 tetratricopeptide repeat protein [Litorilinea aerophila]OUC09834.1 hypothetical protein RY27_00450 [Litorilinea aerophila]